MGIFDPVIPNKDNKSTSLFTPVVTIDKNNTKGYIEPSLENSFEPSNINVSNYDTKLQSEFTDAINSFRRGIDQTQISNYQGKLDSYQEIIDNNVDKYNQLNELYKQGKLDIGTFQSEVQKINEENSEAYNQINSFQSDIEDNKVEMQDEYVSRIYQMKEAMVQAKGGDAGLWESLKYTAPSTIGSSASLMGQQLAATFGTGFIKKLAVAATEGAVGGPVGEVIALSATLGTTIGLLTNSRYQETMAEIGGQLEQNQTKLLEKWMQENPGLEPDDEVLRQIRIQARKGKDELFKEQMMLAIPDAIEATLLPGSKILGSFKTGRKIERAVDGITDYNKISRTATTLGKTYTGYLGEKFEEGFQYASGKRQESKALNLGLYEDKGFMANLLADSYDTVSSLSYGPWGTLQNKDGRYSQDKEFQFAEQSGGLLSILPGSVAAATSIYKDINTYRETNKELQKAGVINSEDKFFKLKDQIYNKHFDNNTISYLLEGVRNLGKQTNEKGIPYLTETEVQTETRNIKEAFNKYLEVSKHIEDIVPQGKFNIKNSPKQNIKIAALKSELFHSSMNLTRYAHKFPIIESVSNINNLIKHNETLIKDIEDNLKSDYTVRKIYNLNDRLSLAKSKLNQLTELKRQLLSGADLKEENIPEINSIEESNKNKEYLINDLNLSESKKEYDDLLKVKDNETLDTWFNNLIKKNKSKKNIVEKEIKKETSAEIKNFAERVFKGEVISSEADQKFYMDNITEIDKEVQNLKKKEAQEANKNAKLKTINESQVNEFPTTPPKAGKKALIPFKSENGWDGVTFFINNAKYGIKSIDSNKYTLKNIKNNSEIVLTSENLEQFAIRELTPSQDRFYRYTNKLQNPAGHKFLPVTKKSNPEIYEYLLAIQDNELDFDNTNARQNDKEDSIYMVLVDSNGNFIKVDNHLLFTYMTRPERIDKGEILSEDREALVKLRNEILALPKGSIKTLEVTGKSAGIPQFEPKVDGQRIGKSVIGTIYDNPNEVQLEIITQAAEDNYGFLSNGQIATIGKLYAIKGDLAIDLIPRKLESREAYELAKLLQDKLNGKKVTEEIEKLIYYGEGTGINKYSVFVKDGILYLGEDITFDKDTFNQEIVEEWLLNNKRVNFNNSIPLDKQFSTPFNPEFKGTYQDYLVLGDNPLFGTDLKSKGDIQFRNQYLIYNPVLTQDTLKSTKPEVNTENKEEVIKPFEDTSLKAKKADIERRRPTSYIRDSKDKKSPLETFRNEAKREWDGVSVITGDRMKNLYVGIQLFVEAYPEHKDLLDKFIKKENGTIGITNNNLSFVLNTLKKQGVTTESELGVKINAKYDAEYVDKVKKGEFTKQQAKDALKEIGRLTPELEKEIDDAELAALEQPSGPYTKAAEETVKKKEKKPRSNSNDFKDRLASRSKDKTLLTKEEENWFISQFPNIPILLVKGLIDNKSLGRFLAAGKVLLSDLATVGTLYHEAFHTVSQLYLTKKEVNAIYKEASEKSGLTDKLELEELLAEDFANYKKTGKILGNRPQRNTIFRKLLNFLKDLFRLEAKNIQDIYRRLDKGFYKNSQPLSKSRFTSLDRALIGKTEKFTKDLLDGIDAIFFKTLHLNNKTEIDSFKYVDAALNKAHDIITGIIKDDDYPYEISEELQDYVYDNWEEISNKWLDRMNSLGAKLKDFDITKDYQEDVIIEESETINPGEDKERSGEAYQEANLKSTKSQMFNSTKFLIRSLVQKNIDGSDKLNELGLPATVEFGKTYNFLLKELVGLGNDYNNYYNKIQELSKTRPEFQQLLDKILPPGGAVSLHQLILQNQFLQDFNKNKAVSYVTLYDGTKIYQVDATKQVIVDRIKDVWQSTVKIKSEIDVEGRLITNVKNEGKHIPYLEKLGITFSPETLKNLEGNKEFNDAAQAIRNYIKANDNNVSLLFSDREISSRITELALIEADYTQDAIELSYMNSEGQTVYSIGYNNFLSNITNTINRVDNLTQLYAELPHLKSVTVEGSLWLKELFNPITGKKVPGVQINLSLKDGVKNKNNDEGISTRSLTIGDKLVQDTNGTLSNGLTNFIRASDKATEHTINLSEYGKNQKLPIPIEDFEDGFDIKELKDIFNNYFKSEFKRIALFDIKGLGKNIDQYQKVGDKWTTFSFLSAKLKKELDQEIKDLKTQDFASIDLNNELDKIAEKYFDKVEPEVIEFFDGYLFEQLKQFSENQINSLQGISSDLNKYNLTTLTRTLIVTDMINSIEQTKLFIGDMAFYKDLFKRTSALTGTKESSRVDNDINNWLNNISENKRLDKKVADGNINAVIFNDSKQQSNYIESYVKALTNSGLSLPDARELLKAYAEWDEKTETYIPAMDEGDAQGWITLDEYREFMIRLGKWDNHKEKSWVKLQNNEILTPEELTYFLPLKAQYFGPQEYDDLYVPAFHKYSLMPLVPQLVKDTNLEVLLNTMTKEQVGYSLFKSGSKIGTPVNSKGKANNFYTEVNSGEINTKDWTKQVISYKYLGLQQKSSEPHAKVIFGTQTRKLLFSNLFESGQVNIDFKGADELLSQYSNIIKNKIKVEKDKLIKELGLNKDTLDSEDVTKIIELLQQEAKDRALPDNLIESLQTEIVEGKKLLKYKFDSMVNKPKIDSMLMSIINSRLIRQKINGDALVQGSSSGFEPKGNRKAGSNSILKFYTNEGPGGSTTHAECMVAMNKNYKPLLDKYNGDLDALNKAIEENKIDVRLLQMIGYRIPTQGLNSIDMLQIKKFLPETSGTLIILPTDIVAKSGGDYDIDKMNVFRPAMDKEGNYIETPDNKIIEIATKVLQDKSNFIALTTPNSTKILTDLVDEVRWIEHKNEKPEYKGTVSEYRKAYQDELKNIKYIDQLKLWFKTKTFQKFMLAKDMIGIAAIQNTHHVLSQLTGLTLNKTYVVKGRDGKPIEKNRVISFEHNRGNNNTIDIGKTYDVEGKNKISEVISQIINATVDAAKDPFLFDLNMTLETLSTYTYLVRIGVPFDTVVYFMKQPIINKYLNELSIKQSMFLGLSKSEAKTEAQNIVKQLYKTDEFFDLDSKVYTAQELKNNLFLENQNTEEFKANQLHILNKFLEYQDQSSMLSDAMKSTNYDTAGLGKNYGVQFLKQKLKDKVAKDNFVNGINRINESFIGAFDQIDFSLKAFGQFYDIYSNPKIASAIQQLVDKINPFKDDDKIKLRTLLENDFIQYITQNYSYDNISELKTKLFNTQSVAKELLSIKLDKENPLNKNLLVQELFPLINQAKNDTDNIKIYARKYDTFQANQLTESFKELQEEGKKINETNFSKSGNPEDLNTPTLAEKLIDVGIIQSGLTNSPITYLGIIPFEYYNELVKKGFENFNKKNGAEELYKFQALFLRENPSGIPKKGWIYGKDFDINSKDDYTEPVKEVSESFEQNEKIINTPLSENNKNKFTYDNHTIETEFQLSNDQEAALKQLIDFVNDGNSDSSFEHTITLQGSAGTGKTTIIGYLQKYFSHKSFSYMAPTHAATAELAFATVKTGNTKFPTTLQSSITTNPITGKPVFTQKIKKKLGSLPVIVVDESSMLDESDILKLRLATEDIGGSLILMGDEKQIPKVVTDNKGTKQVSSAFTKYKQINLTQVHRQSDNTLLSLLTKMREQKEFQLFKVKQNTDNVKFLNLRDYDQDLEKTLKSQPEGTVAITYTNNQVKQLNSDIRSLLGRSGETKVGDIVVGYLGYASKQIEKGDVANSIIYTIEKIENEGSQKALYVTSKKLKEVIDKGIKNISEKAWTRYYQLSEDDSLTFDDLTNQDFEENNQILSSIMRGLHEKNLEYQNKQITYYSYLDYIAVVSETLRKFSIGNSYIYNPSTDKMEKFDPIKHKGIKSQGQGSLLIEKDIDYGHAITIHKSQGTTIDNVYFDTRGLNPKQDTKILDESGNQITTEKQSLAYVAMSRSKKKLVVYTSDLHFQEIDNTQNQLESTEVKPSEQIYSQLGNKTQSENVILPKDLEDNTVYEGKNFWDKIVPEAKSMFDRKFPGQKPMIIAFRGNGKKSFLQNYKEQFIVGNPFDWQTETGSREEKGIKSTKKFIDWLITGNNFGNANAKEEYRQAIINDIKSGKITKSPILYYEEKDYATHATALDYLINKYDWNQPKSEVKPVSGESKKVIPLTQNFSRESVKQDSDYLYLFTDNAERASGKTNVDLNSWYVKKYQTSKRLITYPTMTQAVIRGLNNAYPITTMVDDNRNQWKDSQFNEYKKIIDDEIETIKSALPNYKGIKFGGEMPFGKGKISNMKESAPKIWNYLNEKLKEIGIDNTGEKPVELSQSNIIEEKNILKSEENSVPLQEEIEPTLESTKLSLKEIYNTEIEWFKSLGINKIEDLDTLDEEELNELLIKYCKR